MVPNEFPRPASDRDSRCDDYIYYCYSNCTNYIFGRDGGHDCGKWKLPAGCAGAWGTYDLECGRGSSFNALVDDGNVIFELYSNQNFGFGQWFSFDSVCNQWSAIWSTTSPYNSTYMSTYSGKPVVMTLISYNRYFS